MKTIIMYLAPIGLTFVLLSCGPSSEEKWAKEKAEADSLYGREAISSSAAVETGKDTTRKFIRTAELKFRVKNVAQTTYQLEDLIRHSGGFVTYTNLQSSIDDKSLTPISSDSLLETIHFSVSNKITVRIPNTLLDSTLRAISNFIDYLDYRIIKANDVGLEILSNRLIQQRVNRHEVRLKTAIDNQGKKLNQTVNAEENLLNKEASADEAKISNLSLQDQINFSTVELLIYQRQAVDRTVVLNDKAIDAYKPGLGTQLFESLKYGWDVLEKLILLIAKCWWLLLIILIAYRVYKKSGTKFQK